MFEVGGALTADYLAISAKFSLDWNFGLPMNRNFVAITRRILAKFNREYKLRLRSLESWYVWINLGFCETAHLPLP